jgi:signal transduction histidine kinase
MIDGVWQPEPARLAALHEEILRISRLVSDMEKLARLEGDLATLERRQTDVGALLADVVRNLEPSFREKGVALNMSRDDGRAAIAEVDPDRLTQAVINLLSNALKFTPAGGKVDVSIRGADAQVRIVVADTGIGISAEHLPRIFERFYRVDASRTRATGGSGIGLSIARAIVEAHGGTLSASSAPGRGSHFILRLPPAPSGG